jgi:murein DD-endopeptidase MepM/ murein hydrolase activator NlpD
MVRMSVKVRMMPRVLKLVLIVALLIAAGGRPPPGGRPPGVAAAQAAALHQVEAGDTWAALAWRYDVSVVDLQQANPHLNRQRQPAVGRTVAVPQSEGVPVTRVGIIERSNDGGLLQTAVRRQLSPWYLASLNGTGTPGRPLLYRPIFIPTGSAPVQEFPPGFDTLELSPVPAHAGEALAFRARTGTVTSVAAFLNDRPLTVHANEGYLLGLGGVGAFYPSGDHELIIVSDGRPAWSQPWRMADREWAFQQITLTGAAAAIDATSIAAERERLFALWSQVTPIPQWDAPFELPIHDYLAVSSAYGVRRSYNGGPYRSYHEGVDFSAYGGTPVYAPAAGTVVLAEFLYVRGGAVILDHGLGIYSGYYHMSDVTVQVGEVVAAGHMVGAVGTTGLSTGNHLHWDLLVAETWIDAAAWLEQDMGCWILEGLGRKCGE